MTRGEALKLVKENLKNKNSKKGEKEEKLELKKNLKLLTQ